MFKRCAFMITSSLDVENRSEDSKWRGVILSYNGIARWFNWVVVVLSLMADPPAVIPL